MINTKQWALWTFLFSALATSPLFAGGPANEAVKIANTTVNYVKDSSITGYIYAQIALDDQLSQENIDVSTEKGVVTLEGTVASDTQASSLIQLASSSSGVVSVDASKLKVKKSTQPFTDLVITAKVKGSLIRENIFDSQDFSGNIQVETKNGVVYLSGSASNTDQVKNAVKLAQSISGVTRVESTIKVVNQ